MIKQPLVVTAPADHIWQLLLSKAPLTIEDIKNFKINEFIAQQLTQGYYKLAWHKEIVGMVNYILEQLNTNTKALGMVTWQQIIEYLVIDQIMVNYTFEDDTQCANSISQMIKGCLALATDKISNIDFIRIFKINMLVKCGNYVVLAKILALFPSATILELIKELKLNDDQLAKLITLGKYAPDLQECASDFKMIIAAEEARVLANPEENIPIISEMLVALTYLGKFDELLQMLGRFPKPLVCSIIQTLSVAKIFDTMMDNFHVYGLDAEAKCINSLNNIIRQCLPDGAKLDIKQAKLLGISSLFQGRQVLSLIMQSLVCTWCIQPPATVLSADLIEEFAMAAKVQHLVDDDIEDDQAHIFAVSVPTPVDAIFLSVLTNKPTNLAAVNLCLQQARTLILERLQQLKVAELKFDNPFKDQLEAVKTYVVNEYLLKINIFMQLGSVLVAKITASFPTAASYDRQDNRAIFKQILHEISLGLSSAGNITAFFATDFTKLEHNIACRYYRQATILYQILLAQDPIAGLIKIIANTKENQPEDIIAVFELLKSDMTVLADIAHSLGQDTLAEKIIGITDEQKRLLLRLLDMLVTTQQVQNFRFELASRYEQIGLVKPQVRQRAQAMQPQIAQHIKQIIDARILIEQMLEAKPSNQTGQ